MMDSRASPADLIRDSSVPLSHQLADVLRRQIVAGQLAPGERLPPEPELGARFGVSRVTVRTAIERLLAEELVVRKQGKGTFVAVPALRQELSGLMGIIPNLHAQGVHPRLKLLACAHAPAPPRIARLLGIAEAPVLQFRRLYEMDAGPLGVCDSWIPDADHITRDLVERSPSYVLLADALDRPVARADLVIKVKKPDAPLTRLLGTHEALLCLERVSHTAAGLKCEFSRFWVRPDKYEFGLSVSGPMPFAAGIVHAA